MYHDIKHLLRINMELEAALRIIAERETPDTIEFLAEKYTALVKAMEDEFEFLAVSGDPVPAPAPVDELEPVCPDPAPVEEPEPSDPDPAPVEEPEPVDLDPTPVEEPEPVDPDPAPVEEPEPVCPDPAPVEEPEPVDPAPAPVEEPEPSDPDPAPVEEPAPDDDTTLDVPVDTTTPPQPTINERSHADRRVADMISERNARDLSRAFTINEKIGFIRGLFCEDRSDFEYTVEQISALDSLDEAYDYLLNDLGWDIENDEVKAFLTIVTNHFNAH